MLALLVPQKTFDPMSQNYSASVFQNWHKIHFLLHIHVCCTIIIAMNKNFYVVYLNSEFQIKKIILIFVRSPIEFLCFLRFAL